MTDPVTLEEEDSYRMRFRTKALIVGGSALVASTLLVSLAAASTQPTGPDVSGWQHPGGARINWARVREAGHSFAIIKATEGTAYANPYFATDAAGARGAHLVVGAYSFVHPSLPLSSATDQARFFVSKIGSPGPPARCRRSSTSRSRAGCHPPSSPGGRSSS
jgi:hypothetical protein